MSSLFGIGGNSASTSFYPHLLEHSLRFDDDSSSHLKRIPTSAGNRRTWTLSMWVKRANLGTHATLFSAGTSNNNQTKIRFIDSSSSIFFDNEVSGSTTVRYTTDNIFRDVSAWYNLVFKLDTTQSSNDNKLKIYVNGTQVTNFSSTPNYPSLSEELFVNNTDTHFIGRELGTGYFDGYLAEVNLIDSPIFSAATTSGSATVTGISSTATLKVGMAVSSSTASVIPDGTTIQSIDSSTQITLSANATATNGSAPLTFSATVDFFGETKEGVWIPKDYEGTHGTNGFYLNFSSTGTAAGFTTVTFAGTGAAQSLTGVGFQPDFVWLKDRTGSSDHVLYDSLRGVNAGLVSNSPNVENTAASSTQDFVSFDSDGFSVGVPSQFSSTGSSGKNIVAWNWEAGGAPSADNSAGAGNVPTAGSVKIDGSNSGSALAGTIPATRLSANTTYGFSIVTYTGTGANGATVAHGLGSAPKMIFIKSREATSADGNWLVYAKAGTVDETDYLLLNSTALATDEVGAFNDTAATSDVFSLGTFVDLNQNTKTYVAYCWTDISGYSKVGGYTGNGSSGHAITTGFAPAWLMVKRVDPTGSANSWYIVDNTRTANMASGNDDLLFANLNNAEGSTNDFFTFTSTGFELNTSSPAVNTSGGEYIYMAFKDTRTSGFYLDQSGNGNNFSALGLEFSDAVPDSPTNNFATLNSLDKGSGVTLKMGNLVTDLVADDAVRSTFHFEIDGSLSFYAEMLVQTTPNNDSALGIVISNTDNLDDSGGASGTYWYFANGNKRSTGSATSYGATWTTGDIIGIAVSGGAVTFYKNNASQGQAFTGLTGSYSIAIGEFNGNGPALRINYGQDSSFGGLKTPQGNADVNGNGDFFYAPPSNHLALCTDNLPNPGIDPNRGDDPEEYFNTVLYTGDGSTNRGITGVGFSPDFTWIKDRSNVNNHVLVDRVRGVSELLYTNSNVAAVTGASQVSSFDSDGFTIGATTYVNENTSSNIYVAWNWKAGGTAVSNGDGSITSNVSASPESGFSIVSYTGTGSAATVGHGLGKVPAWIIIKNRGTGSREWMIYHHESEGVPQNFGMFFGASPSVAPFDDDSAFNDTAPTTTVFSVKDSASTNNAGEGHIAYCFAEIEGFSKFGRYSGAGGADNQFVYLGFRPAWFLLKRVNSTGDWVLYDNTRDPFNVGSSRLSANLSAARLDGASNYGIDFLSNGVKFRSGQADTAVSGGTYIYMAFAEQPFKYANAR